MSAVRFWMVVGCFVAGVMGVNGQVDTIRARELASQGVVLFNANDYNNAFNKLDSAQLIYKNTIGIKTSLYASTLYWKARCFNELGAVDSAFTLHEIALNIRINDLENNHLDVVDSYTILGGMYLIKGQYDKGIEYFQKSLDIKTKMLDINDPAFSISYLSLGSACLGKGDYDRAIEYYTKGISFIITDPGNNLSNLIKGYDGLGNCYIQKGVYDIAIEYLEKSLTLKLEYLKSNYSSIAASYDYLGTVSFKKGDYDNAIALHNKALQYGIQALGEKHWNLGYFYSNIGLCYSEKGDYDLAIDYFQKALLALKTFFSDSHPSVLSIYNNLGNQYARKKNHGMAFFYHKKTLEERILVLGPNHPLVASSYNSMGNRYYDIYEYNKAIESYQKSIEIRSKYLGVNHPSLILPYSNIGNCYFEMGLYNLSIESLDKALKISIATFGHTHPDVGATYNYLGHCYLLRGDFLTAVEMLNNSKKALNYKYNNEFGGVSSMLELIRCLTLEGDSYFMGYQVQKEKNKELLYSAYNSHIQTLQALLYQFSKTIYGNTKINLINLYYPVFERTISKSQKLYMLTDSIKYAISSFYINEKSRSLQLHQALQNSEALFFNIPDIFIKQEYVLRVNVADQDKKYHEKIQTGLTETDTTVLAISSKLFDLREQHEALKKRFETEYPEYYRLKYDLSTVSLDYVQDTLLMPDQSLLSYFVGDSAVYVYLVNRDTFMLHEITKDSIEAWADSLRAALQQPATRTMSNSRKLALRNKYILYAKQIYNKLVEPVAALLKPSVMIVPDGKLGYIPFEALLTGAPANPENYASYPYLLKERTISYNYSATLAKEMQDKQHRLEPRPQALAMAPFATKTTEEYVEIQDSIEMGISPRGSLKPLLYSGDEAKAVVQKTGGQAYYGRSATLEAFQREAPQYRILHLPTHGFPDDRVGDYAYLAFSTPGNDTNFSKLYVRDLYNMSLNADMVVLSACETGTGVLKRGEGIISMARAFAYAGAKSIFTTLWKIDDNKTSILMEKFYSHLQKGMSKDAALRQAKLDLIAKEKSHPYFWAAFIGIGDMKPLNKK